MLESGELAGIMVDAKLQRKASTRRRGADRTMRFNTSKYLRSSEASPPARC